MPFESDRSLAAVGALLIGIGSFVPFLGLVGIILLLIGMKGLASYYGDNRIFSYALWGLIFGIIGIVATGAIVLAGFIAGAFFFIPFGASFVFLGLFIVALVVAFVFLLLDALYFKRSFDILRNRSGVGLFGTAGTMLLVGAILVIVLVGLLLLLVAWILVAVAFFSMRPMEGGVPGPGVPVPPSPPAPVSMEKKTCTYCGAENKLDAEYCSHCGQKL